MILFSLFQELRNLKAYGELAAGQRRGNAVPMEATGTEIRMSNRCALTQEAVPSRDTQQKEWTADRHCEKVSAAKLPPFRTQKRKQI
jgi:hypothetical protein